MTPLVKHTPGPWTFSQQRGLRLFIVANDEAIAELPIEGKFNDTIFANARLMAAAPNMFDALHELNLHLTGLRCYLETCSTEVIIDNLETTIAALRAKADLAEAALKKVKGE